MRVMLHVCTQVKFGWKLREKEIYPFLLSIWCSPDLIHKLLSLQYHPPSKECVFTRGTK